ncbi:SMI1/KNR4 family protein [Kitasatospora sp. NPDC056783]|uniref:SMI1/KNR4 family protein n=1 Tax=Kitasatospora sp. NPDC056783 TaxID=3345943 RepID=UPI0036807895
MAHPAVSRLLTLLGEPITPGDSVDWDELAQTTGLRLPSDYRDFVALYGGGELDEYLSIRTPPVGASPYGVLVDELDFDPGELPPTPTGTAQENLEEGRLLPFARSANSDVVFWLCDAQDPDSWDIVVFRRQVQYGEERWVRFEAGFGEFLFGTLSGMLPNPFSDSGFANSPHTYRNWQQPL